MATLRDVMVCRRGASAIEYGLIAALIAVAISGAVAAVGVDLSNLFGRVSTELPDTGTDQGAEPPPPGGETVTPPDPPDNTNDNWIIIRPRGDVNR
jgi:pilus assembly protein Flp/PilA